MSLLQTVRQGSWLGGKDRVWNNTLNNTVLQQKNRRECGEAALAGLALETVFCTSCVPGVGHEKRQGENQLLPSSVIGARKRSRLRGVHFRRRAPQTWPPGSQTNR